MEFEEAVQKVISLLEGRENYQRALGEIASNIRKEFGADALKDFSEEVKETSGLTVSFSSLKNYAWVYDKVLVHKPPEDLSFHVLQVIAGTPHPEKWLAAVKNFGYSSADIIRLIEGDHKKKCRICGTKLKRGWYCPNQNEKSHSTEV